jgi:hypothetical protein
MHQNRGHNRLGLGLVGVVLLAAGAYGLAQHYGAFDVTQQHDSILLPDVRNFVSDNRDWFWWAAGGVAVAVALLALLWLRSQLRMPLPANSHLDRLEVDGRTRLSGGAAADALAADVDALPGVSSAAARIWGDPTKPDVYLRVQLHDDAEVDSLRSDIETTRLARLRQALQVEHLDATVDLRLASPQGRTVE